MGRKKSGNDGVLGLLALGAVALVIKYWEVLLVASICGVVIYLIFKFIFSGVKRN